MAKRSVHPALYEVIRTRPTERPSTSVEVESVPSRMDSGPGAVRTVRVPVGYLWMAGAAVLALLVVAYMVGHSRGEAAGALSRARVLQEEIDGALLGTGAGVTDPLAGSRTAEEPQATVPGARDSRPEGDRTRGGRTSAGQGGPPAVTDPRVIDHFYFVLAHPDADRAPDMVAFLRANGLDAYVVRDHNGTLRKVVVLPGYASAAQRQSEEIKQLEAKIRSVGLKWKAAARGNTDLGDYYPEKHRSR